MTTTGADPGLVALHRDEADELAYLLGHVEDWLRHAGYDTREELAAFLGGAGNGHLAAAGLIDLIGTHAAVLHRRLKEMTR